MRTVTSSPCPTLLGCWRTPEKLPARTEMPVTHLRLGKVLFDLEKDVPKPLCAQCFVLLVGTNSPFLGIICTTFTHGEVGFEPAQETCPEAVAATKKISERETLV